MPGAFTSLQNLPIAIEEFRPHWLVSIVDPATNFARGIKGANVAGPSDNILAFVRKTIRNHLLELPLPRAAALRQSVLESGWGMRGTHGQD